jgi:hypothetical protein
MAQNLYAGPTYTEHFAHDSQPGCGLGSSVGIATGYGLDGPGIKYRWRQDFLHLSRPALGPTQPLTMGTGSSSGVKGSWDVTLTPHPLLVPWSWKSRAIPLLPYRPYGLYRASVPVQGCTLAFYLTNRLIWT